MINLKDVPSRLCFNRGHKSNMQHFNSKRYVDKQISIKDNSVTLVSLFLFFWCRVYPSRQCLTLKLTRIVSWTTSEERSFRSWVGMTPAGGKEFATGRSASSPTITWNSSTVKSKSEMKSKRKISWILTHHRSIASRADKLLFLHSVQVECDVKSVRWWSLRVVKSAVGCYCCFFHFSVMYGVLHQF